MTDSMKNPIQKAPSNITNLAIQLENHSDKQFV
jgi:hypothetical protein